eukprot:scaffold2125_cov363-Pavlova_lutheri.AAC.1
MLGLGVADQATVLDDEREISICSVFPDLEVCSPLHLGPSRDQESEPAGNVDGAGNVDVRVHRDQGNNMDPTEGNRNGVQVLSTVNDSHSEVNHSYSVFCRFVYFLPQCRRPNGDSTSDESKSFAMSLQDVEIRQSQETRPTVCKLFPESSACFYALGTVVGAPMSEEWMDGLFDEQEEDDFFFAAPSALFEPPVISPPAAAPELPAPVPAPEPTVPKKSHPGRPSLYDALDLVARTSSPVGLIGSAWANIRSKLDLTEKQQRRVRFATAAAIMGWSKIIVANIERRQKEHASGVPFPLEESAEQYFFGPAKCACHLGYPKDIDCLLFDWQCRPMYVASEDTARTEDHDGYGGVTSISSVQEGV